MCTENVYYNITSIVKTMDILTTVYLLNSVLLIVHEIDSAYQEEWKLFQIPGGISVFLLLHIPLVGLMMYGLLEVSVGSSLGTILSLIVSGGGLFAFAIHTYFISKGNTKFTSQTSRILLYAILVTSATQFIITVL